MLQKTLDPFQRPRIGPFSGSLRECIRCFTRRNFGKAQSRSRTDPRPCQFSEILRGDRGIFQACPASSDRPRVTSKRRQFKRSPNLINNRRRKISTPEKRKLPAPSAPMTGFKSRIASSNWEIHCFLKWTCRQRPSSGVLRHLTRMDCRHLSGLASRESIRPGKLLDELRP